MAVLPKGGLSVGGRKIPWEAIAALAGVAGVLLVLRARHQGQNVAAVGQAPAAPYTAASSGFGAGFGPDYSGALANISQQLTSLNQQQAVAGPTPAAPAAPDTNKIGVLPFDLWLSGAFTGTRPDLAQGVAQGRWADIQGEYVKEVAGSEAQQLAAGRHF